jgi:ubiquinone biosynthesis protein COQ9
MILISTFISLISTRLKVTEKIVKLTKERLMLTSPILKQWPQVFGVMNNPKAVRLMTMPENLPTTLKQLNELVDDIWFLAGDVSVDLNWYSKRLLLAGVYTTTGYLGILILELFMTTDSSPDFVNTWNFLSRRIDNVGTLGRSVSEASTLISFGSSQAYSIFRSFK